MGEFELIERFFRRPAAGGFVALGIGDDCALLAPEPGHRLAVSSDMLVEGRHFLPTVDPQALGHKALAVNLSDLAACAARPRAFTLALSLPRADEHWVGAFADGLFALADAHGCVLAGGDTTQGPLNICITVIGDVPAQGALLRSAAKASEDIYVSGTPGRARAALEVFRGKLDLPAPLFALARQHMERPQPRVALGLALRGLASSAIDVSDGLLGDLGHVMRASALAAQIDATAVEEAVVRNDPVLADLPRALALQFVLAGGDDYELAFTAAVGHRQAIQEVARQCGVSVTRIGQTVDGSGVRVVDAAGRQLDQVFDSFDHFA